MTQRIFIFENSIQVINYINKCPVTFVKDLKNKIFVKFHVRKSCLLIFQ